MKTFLQIFLLVAVVLTLGACGKSDEQKAQDHAQDLTQEQNSLANYFNTAGVPSSTWTDQQLNDYEAKLNRLEKVDADLHDSSGHDGVVIFGGDNTTQIENRRLWLTMARDSKKLESSPKSSVS
jgi:uncharacterized lipoprotein